MNAQPDGFLGKASLRIAKAKALSNQHVNIVKQDSTHPMIGMT